jgi:hypothetical protein
MGLIAGGIALASVGAGIASSAMKKRGVDTHQSALYTPRSLRERILDKEVTAINRLQTNLTTNALGQFSNLSPELYASALGLVPQYADVSPRVRELTEQSQRLKSRSSKFQSMMEMKKEDRPYPWNLPGKRWNRKELRKKFKQAEGKAIRLDRNLRDIEAMPKRITGFTKASPDDLPADSPLSSKNLRNQISALTDESLIRALRGEEPLDQSMVNRWRDRESDIRTQLRRNLGPDYETSSAGLETIAQFEEDKDAAFQNFNRDTILKYSALSQGNAQIREQQLSGILERGVFLPEHMAGLAGQLSRPVAGFETALTRLQTGRRLSAPQLTKKDPGFAHEVLGQTASGLSGLLSSGAGGGIGKALSGFTGKFTGSSEQDPLEGFTGFTGSSGQTTALGTPTGNIIR